MKNILLTIGITTLFLTSLPFVFLFLPFILGILIFFWFVDIDLYAETGFEIVASFGYLIFLAIVCTAWIILVLSLIIIV